MPRVHSCIFVSHLVELILLYTIERTESERERERGSGGDHFESSSVAPRRYPRMEDSGIERLPEGCVAHAIAFTSPGDACRSSAVSTAFRSAAFSDTVWECFLPDDHRSLLSRAVYPVEFSSKRELFFLLCDSILIDDGKMSLWLDRSSGAKCFMVSARELSIVWGDTPQYWRWVSLPDSRFAEVAELNDVCWLEIRGKIQLEMLTRKATYAAYLVYKLADWSRGLAHPPQEASVTVGLRSSTTHMVRLQPSDDPAHARSNRSRFGPLRRPIHPDVGGEEAGGGGGGAFAPSVPRVRDDGWMEVEMGAFYNDEGDEGEVVMSLMQVKSSNWKKGLIIQGIEIRPKIAGTTKLVC
ncbi:F-box protein PP2-B12 [Canna indica]|uniref:F-box protein PP2-B12 n=1 Tax=Canna indica TaxID=4628 RepID=A0AAQ3Q461_9LILI|nr:F-box protein PP2-B12 [Canna indica]